MCRVTIIIEAGVVRIQCAACVTQVIRRQPAQVEYCYDIPLFFSYRTVIFTECATRNPSVGYAINNSADPSQVYTPVNVGDGRLVFCPPGLHVTGTIINPTLSSGGQQAQASPTTSTVAQNTSGYTNQPNTAGYTDPSTSSGYSSQPPAPTEQPQPSTSGYQRQPPPSTSEYVPQPSTSGYIPPTTATVADAQPVASDTQQLEARQAEFAVPIRVPPRTAASRIPQPTPSAGEPQASTSRQPYQQRILRYPSPAETIQYGEDPEERQSVRRTPAARRLDFSQNSAFTRLVETGRETHDTSTVESEELRSSRDSPSSTVNSPPLTRSQARRAQNQASTSEDVGDSTDSPPARRARRNHPRTAFVPPSRSPSPIPVDATPISDDEEELQPPVLRRQPALVTPDQSPTSDRAGPPTPTESEYQYRFEEDPRPAYSPNVVVNQVPAHMTPYRSLSTPELTGDPFTD